MRLRSPSVWPGSVAVARAIIGDGQATALGVTGQHSVALLLTAFGVIGCCTAYMATWVCRAWSRCWWRHQRLPLSEPGRKPSIYTSHVRNVRERPSVAARAERLHQEGRGADDEEEEILT